MKKSSVSRWQVTNVESRNIKDILDKCVVMLWVLLRKVLGEKLIHDLFKKNLKLKV